MTKKSFSWIDFVPVTFVSILFISQIIVGIYLLSDVSQVAILAYVGAGLYVFARILACLLASILTLCKYKAHAHYF